jgi:hypothetical protein
MALDHSMRFDAVDMQSVHFRGFLVQSLALSKDVFHHCFELINDI